MNNNQESLPQDNDIQNQFMHNIPTHNQPNIQTIKTQPNQINPIKQPKQQNLKKKKTQSKKHQKGVQDNPQYFRVDFQITHKLYQIYRRLKIIPNEQLQSYNFEEKEQGNTTINYHKIIEMFKDINYKLEINQKLQILRAIKKFCFNQNFINQDQFIKIFKVIVHGIGIKESVFRGIIAEKYTSIIQKDNKNNNKFRAISIKLNKNFGKKLKTQSQMQNSKVKSQFAYLQQQQKSFQTIINHDSYLKKIPSMNPSILINQKISQPHSIKQSPLKTVRKLQSRHRMLTQINRYQIGDKGYLYRAIQKNKLGKLTWENLYNMKDDNLQYNISIPAFVGRDVELDDLDI